MPVQQPQHRYDGRTNARTAAWPPQDAMPSPGR